MQFKVFDTMAQSWVISCGVCQRLRVPESHERNFFRWLLFCFCLFWSSWSKRFVVSLGSRFVLFFTMADRDIEERRHLCFWMRSHRVRPSFAVMTLRFQRCDYFSFSNFVLLRFVCGKCRLWSGGRGLLWREAREELTRRTDEVVPQSYRPLQLLLLAVQPVTVFRDS